MNENTCNDNNLSYKKKLFCKALTIERIFIIIDSNRNIIPFPLLSYQHFNNYSNLNYNEWKLHLNWNKQTLLLSSHCYFRGISQDIVCGIYELYNILNNSLKIYKSLIIKIDKLLTKFKNDLISHAIYEENILYPRLQVYWNNEENQKTLHDQHEVLDHQMETLHSLIKGVIEDPDNLPQEELLFLLLTAIELDEILLHHLAYEEDLIVPVLLSLSPEEFEAVAA